jgi:Fe-S-cluster containining protein
MGESAVLTLLRESVRERTAQIEAAVKDWPCRRGCDYCCRHLAAQPLLTIDEWDALRVHIESLDVDTQREIQSRYDELESGSPPIICPFLHRTRGECHVYPARPLACRSYGFYVERGRGLYCGQIEERVESGDFDGLIWGNHETVEARLEAIGPRRPLLEWLRDSRYPQ